MRDALLSVRRQTGELPEELRDLPEAPPEAAFVIDVFRELTRPNVQGVWMPITNQEIAAWCWLNRIRLRPWELRLLRVLDLAFLRAMNRAASEQGLPPR